MLKFKKTLHVHGTFCHFLLQTGHIFEQLAQLLKSLVLKKLEVEFPAINERIEVETFQLFGGFFDGFEEERQRGYFLELCFEILVDEGEFWLLLELPSSYI